MLSKVGKRKAERQAKEIAAHQEREAAVFRRELATIGSAIRNAPGALNDGELWWCNRYEWLKNCGFLLRSRYAPGWKPSWQGTNKIPGLCEDGIVPSFNHLIDATRVSDGMFVILKIVKKSRHPYEADIGKFFMSEALASDPSNHCVPIYDILSVPEDDDRVILVMPLLRRYSDPQFDTIGEVIDCIHQVFEGLRFMHAHHVAHRDCMNLNIMMDATSLYIDAFHPFQSDWKRDLSGFARHFTRTRRPPKYYLIDFGISRRYDPSDIKPLEPPIIGGDKTVPEFQDSVEPQNPFPTDIYYLGNLLREDFMQLKEGFGFLEPLVADMVQDDPIKRPTIDEVVSRFDTICEGLSGWKLRSRIVPKDENIISGLFRDVGHWTRRFISMARREPPIPTLRS